MKYRKKPVVIDAIRFAEPYVRVKEFCRILQWVKGDNGKILFALIPTLEGHMRAEVGDWIIKGVQGEFYPCKPDIFEATYEVAE